MVESGCRERGFEGEAKTVIVVLASYRYHYRSSVTDERVHLEAYTIMPILGRLCKRTGGIESTSSLVLPIHGAFISSAIHSR